DEVLAGADDRSGVLRERADGELGSRGRPVGVDLARLGERVEVQSKMFFLVLEEDLLGEALARLVDLRVDDDRRPLAHMARTRDPNLVIASRGRARGGRAAGHQKKNEDGSHAPAIL